jgi:pSer/pThr/pTyr-binding forkhead associated (FHA) protein
MSQPARPPQSSSPGLRQRGLGRRFWLEHAGGSISLRQGRILLGRSSSCHVVLDDPLVSRRHAKLEVDLDGVSVEDLGSVNGVLVNARRIHGNAPLREGDRLQIGRLEFVLRSSSIPPSDGAARFGAETLQDMPAVAGPESGDSAVTFSGETLDLLGGVAEKVLALGRGDEAERVLGNVLANILKEAQQRRVAVAPQILEKAAGYSVRLAEATGHGRWLDHAFDLYASVARPLPAPLVDRIYEVVRKTSGISLVRLRAYLETLNAAKDRFGPSERFALQRLEGLERQIASR